jgi:hypothetical protein
MRFRGLEKSSYFEWLEEKARIEGAREILLRLGGIKFGPPDKKAGREIASIDDMESLQRLSERLLLVSTWAELLDESS